MRRFLDDPRERLAKSALEPHPEKTRLIPSGRYAKADRPGEEGEGPGTSGFLGFTHVTARSSGGRLLLKRQSMRGRMRAKLAQIKEEMRYRSHQRIAGQGKWLKSLRRRSPRHDMPWERMNRIIDAWIPPAIIRHPWPNQRFDVKHPRQEPGALAARARIWAGRAA